jgi:sulfur carrier protein
MDVIINGSTFSMADGSTVLDLLASKKIDPAVVVVERNRAIVRKENFGTVTLKNGDVVELLRFVGGG